MSFDFLNLTSDLQRIYSPRIALRQVSLSDGWPLFEATKNPLFNKNLAWTQPESDGPVLERIDLIMDAVAQGKMSAVSVVSRTTGEWMGLFRFSPYQDRDDTIEVGFWSKDKFWSGRYGMEVGMLCIHSAFRLSDVQRVVAVTTINNRSAAFNLARGGMQPKGFSTRPTEDGLRTLQLQEYAVTREEWSTGDQGGRIFNFQTRDHSLGHITPPLMKPGMEQSLVTH